MAKNASQNGTAPITVVETEHEGLNQESALTLQRIETRIIQIPIEGITPLIVHAWSEKARAMMANSETVKRKKEPRDPEGDYQAARYLLEDGRDGFPAVGFKAAIVGAARLFEGVTMTALKQWVFVQGLGAQQLVPIDGEISRREDMVRVGQGVADIRWRPQFWPWRATLAVEFVANAITPSSILNLVDAAGIGGVGEWRPSAPKGMTGTYGRFAVSVPSKV